MSIKRKRKPKKVIQKAPLQFKEKCFEGDIHYASSIYVGDPVQLPTRKLSYHASSVWVSPQVKNSEVGTHCLIMQSRRKLRPRPNVTSQNLNSSKKLDHIPLDISVTITPKKEACLERKCPVANNITTPDFILTPGKNTELLPNKIPSSGLHFIFQGETPVCVKNCVVLVEDTPHAILDNTPETNLFNFLY